MKPVSPNTIVKLSLTVEQINLLFAALEQMPYAKVVMIIDDIKHQVMPQVEQSETEVKE